MILDRRTPQQVAADDVQSLIDPAVLEGRRLGYSGDLPTSQRASVVESLKDVSATAKSHGTFSSRASTESERNGLNLSRRNSNSTGPTTEMARCVFVELMPTAWPSGVDPKVLGRVVQSQSAGSFGERVAFCTPCAARAQLLRMRSVLVVETGRIHSQRECVAGVPYKGYIAAGLESDGLDAMMVPVESLN